LLHHKQMKTDDRFRLCLSMVCLLVLREIWMLHLFAFSYGVFHGVRISAQVGVLPDIFGMRSLGELIGITAAAGQPKILGQLSFGLLPKRLKTALS